MKESFLNKIVLILEQVLLGFYHIFKSLLICLKGKTVTDLLICVIEIQVGLSGHLLGVCLYTCLLIPKKMSYQPIWKQYYSGMIQRMTTV